MATIAAAIIGAGATYYATQQAKKKSAQQKAMEAQQYGFGTQLGGFGTEQLKQGAANLQMPVGYFSRLAGGNRASALQSLSPELTALDQSDRSSMGAAAELAPRGGGSGDFYSRMPFRRNAQTQNLLFGARSNAMTQLAGIGQNQQQMGLNAISGGQAGNMGLLNFGLQRNNQQFQQGGDTGAGIYQIVKAFTDAYAKKRGSTAAGANANPFAASGGSSNTGYNPSTGGWNAGGYGGV